MERHSPAFHHAANCRCQGLNAGGAIQGRITQLGHEGLHAVGDLASEEGCRPNQTSAGKRRLNGRFCEVPNQTAEELLAGVTAGTVGLPQPD